MATPVTGSLTIDGVAVPFTGSIPTIPAGAAGVSPTAAAVAAVLAATPAFVTAVATAMGGTLTSSPIVIPPIITPPVSGATAVNLNASLTSPFAAPASVPIVKVSGNKLVNGAGKTVQLRGVNVSALEFNVINQPQVPPGGVAFDYWGGQNPSLAALQAWKVNAVRLPLNEQCYLSQTCYSTPTSSVLADPIKSYRGVVKAFVDELTASGMYVILDLHKNVGKALLTGSTTPLQILSNTSGQQEMADADNSLTFWTSVATDYKNYPNVIFDLFNEPHIDNFSYPPNMVAVPNEPPEITSEWLILRDGGVGSVNYGNQQTFIGAWQSAGMQAMLTAVRAAGATNVCMTAGVSWAQDNSQWVKYAPVDPLKQLACSWHAYPNASNPAAPGFPNNFAWAAAILAAGYPIIIGETGDLSSNGATSQWLTPTLLPWADTNSVSVMAWSWNVWGATNDDLIKDASGTPTDGEGVAFKNWCVNHA